MFLEAGLDDVEFARRRARTAVLVAIGHESDSDKLICRFRSQGTAADRTNTEEEESICGDR